MRYLQIDSRILKKMGMVRVVCDMTFFSIYFFLSIFQHFFCSGHMNLCYFNLPIYFFFKKNEVKQNFLLGPNRHVAYDTNVSLKVHFSQKVLQLKKIKFLKVSFILIIINMHKKIYSNIYSILEKTKVMFVSYTSFCVVYDKSYVY